MVVTARKSVIGSTASKTASAAEEPFSRQSSPDLTQLPESFVWV
jgi:hypothetical protein